MRTTTNVHGVARIEIERCDHGDFVAHEVKFILDDESEVTVSGFASVALEFVRLPDRKSGAVKAREAREAAAEAA